MRFDEINKLSNNNSKVLDIYTYFDEMGISREQKSKRIDLATELKGVILLLFALYTQQEEYNAINPNFLKLQAMREIEDIASRYTTVDSYLFGQITQAVDSIVDTTVKDATSDSEWFLSDDRATFIAEDESNSILNYAEYKDATDNNLKTKTWHTMEDKKVRQSHEDIDRKTIPIDDYFDVGKYLMKFPKDTELGGYAESVNCRCWVTYQ